MPHILSDTKERAEALFAEGMTSSRVADRLRISTAEALELKKAWIDAKAPPKAEKPAGKAKKAKSGD